MLRVAGVAAAAALVGDGQRDDHSPAVAPDAAAQPSTGQSARPTLTLSPDLHLGGRRVVGGPGAGGYDTIRAAWEAANSGDSIYIHSTYDAQAAGEEFPIRLDFREKEVMLTGGHPSGSVIDASHVDRNVIEVVGEGHGDYRNDPVVQNLKVVGGNVGLTIVGAPFSSYQNLVFNRTASHAVEVRKYDADGTTYGTFGTTFYNCQAWGCGGTGFYLSGDSAPHGTTFLCCTATACGDVGFRLRGASTKMIGGVSQLNRGWGIEVRGGYNALVQGVYIEGNARGPEHSMPTECYVRDADGLSVEHCYFHGIYPRSAEHDFARVQRGITAHDTVGLTTRACTVRRYERGYLALYNCTDVDVHRTSHVLQEAELFGGGVGTRTRSDGVILPVDLSTVEGAFDGDMGYHLGSEREGLAVWRDGRWHLVETTTL